MVNQRTRVLHNWNSDVLCTLLRTRELDKSLEVYVCWTLTRLIRIQRTHILRLFLWIRLILSFGRILVSIGCAILCTNTMNWEVLLLLVRTTVDFEGKVTTTVSASLQFMLHGSATIRCLSTESLMKLVCLCSEWSRWWFYSLENWMDFLVFGLSFNCYLGNFVNQWWWVLERERDLIFCLFWRYDGLITHFTSVNGGSCGICNLVGHSGGNFSNSRDHCCGIS